MKIQKVKGRHIGAFLFSLGFILVQSSFVLAAPVEYYFTYDPLTLLTTIYNLPTSSSTIDFHTLVGTDAFNKDFGLAPGATVIVDQFGNVAGSFLDYDPVCTNKLPNLTTNTTIYHYGFDNITVTFRSGSSNKTVSLGFDQQIFLKPENAPATVTGDKFEIIENTITTLAPSSLVIDSPSWINPGQVNYQLLYGSVDSVDDTGYFSTIFDSYVGTGCIPEPSILTLLGFGSLGLLACDWRRRKAKA